MGMRAFVYGCACKGTYPSREAAAIVLDRMKFQRRVTGRSKASHCGLCGAWHISHNARKRGCSDAGASVCGEADIQAARLRATSPTYGAVTIIVVSEPREEQFYVMCLDTAISGPRLIRAWKRRHWIEHCFRTLKHLLATGACQVHNEDAYYGHMVLRLMGCFVLFYTSRVVCKGRLTMQDNHRPLSGRTML